MRYVVIMDTDDELSEDSAREWAGDAGDGMRVVSIADQTTGRQLWSRSDEPQPVEPTDNAQVDTAPQAGGEPAARAEVDRPDRQRAPA